MWRTLVKVVSARIAKLNNSVVKRTHIAKLMETVQHDAVILEIGGGYNPRFIKQHYPNVYHLDHCTGDELRAKYSRAEMGVAHRVSNIQDVDFVFAGEPIETLIPSELRFDVIYGSHVLEHQVDFIGHLHSLATLVKPGGRIIEVIPDLRTCFDALRFPTVTSDVLVVHAKRPGIHQGKQVFDYLSRMINVDRGYRLRDGDLDGVGFTNSLQQAHAQMLAMEQAGADYLDSHAWAFTPESFELLMLELRLLGMTNLVPTYVSPQYGNQFCVVLEAKAGDVTTLPAHELATLEAKRFELSRQLRI
jgi:SAM-dependent methyltransferase